MSRDLTAAEAGEAFKALTARVGPKAWLSVSLAVESWRGKEGALACSIYPEGVTGNSKIGHPTVYADTWKALVAVATSKWEEVEAEHGKRRVKQMALEIIRITDEIGHCTDAAIRSAGFSTDEVKRWGEDACASATQMASRGPFSIAAAGKSNGAPVEVEAA